MPQGKGVVAIEAQSLCKKIKKRIFKITGEFLLMLPFFYWLFFKTDQFIFHNWEKKKFNFCMWSQI